MEQLSIVEVSQLRDLELVIETGLQTFYKVGEALLKIKENKLYKSEFDTFEDYCLSKWNISRDYGYKLIQASNVISNLYTIVDKPTEIINSESKARILGKFSPEIQRLIIQDLQLNNLEEGLTASFLEGFSKAYVLADIKVKENKKETLFSFDNEQDLLSYAKQFIQPEIKEIEVIKEVKVIDNTLVEEKENKINELKNRITQQSENNQSLQLKIRDLEHKAKEVIKDFDSKIFELNQLKEKETEFKRIQNALFQINDLEKKKLELLNDSDNIREMFKAFNTGKTFFNQNILYIATLNINEGSKEAMQKDITEFLAVIDNWKFAIAQKFLNNNLVTGDN